MKIRVRTAVVKYYPQKDNLVVGFMRLIFSHEGRDDWTSRRIVYTVEYDPSNGESLRSAWSHVTAEVAAMAKAFTGERVPRPTEEDFERAHWSWRDEETHEEMSRVQREPWEIGK